MITSKNKLTPVKNIAIISVTYSQSPVDIQVERDEDEVIWEKVDSFGPALHLSVSPQPASSAPQLGEEEGAEGIHLQFCCLISASFHYQGQVEVDHLWCTKEKHDTWN